MKLQVKAPLDQGFTPLGLIERDYRRAVAAVGGMPIALAVVRDRDQVVTYRMDIFKPDAGRDAETWPVVERVVKSLLWFYGGWKIVVGGHLDLYQRLKEAYAVGGARDFDRGFMARVYERPFEVVYVENAADVPDSREQTAPIGRHLDGCRIGFDAGGSDRKVSAVIDGESVFSEEVIWHPKTQADPQYQYDGILDSMRRAAAHMPRVDAIGISSAGVYINNRIMVASLFLKVSEADFERRVKNMYIDVCREFGDVPMEVANDGDVTALAGAMDLNDGCVLGIAMGTSEAGGYVDANGSITGRLNELAFVPVDLQAGAPVDEWSGDAGCGVKYFSQDAVIRLAPLAGIELPEGATLAEQLKFVQNLDQAGDPRVKPIFETIGVYFGHAIAYYARFCEIRHVLIMGRVTSGGGGPAILEKAEAVLKAEYPELHGIVLHIPDEKSRRVGQSAAAASLPPIKAQ